MKREANPLTEISLIVTYERASHNKTYQPQSIFRNLRLYGQRL